MSEKLDETARRILESQQGANIMKKKKEIANLAASQDGAAVKSMFEQNSGIKDALGRGDVDALKDAVSNILKTDEGARLAKKLSEMMK